jgi:hypothetical protein
MMPAKPMHGGHFSQRSETIAMCGMAQWSLGTCLLTPNKNIIDYN